MKSFLNRSNIYQHIIQENAVFASIALLGLVVILPLGQLTQLPLGPLLNYFELPQHSIRIYAHDMLVVIFLLFTAIHKNHFFKIAFAWIKQQRLAAIFLLMIIGSSIYASVVTASLSPILYSTRIFTYALFAIALNYQLPNKRSILSLATISLSYYAWLGILQFLFLPDTRFLAALGWDDHYYRMIGTLFDPNFTGSLLILFFWGIVAYKKLLPTWIWQIGLLLIMLLISITYSRASYLAFGISGLYFLLRSHLGISKKTVLSCLGVGLVLLLSWFLIPKPGGEGVNLLRTASITARIEHSIVPLQSLSAIEWLVGTGLFVHPATHQVWMPDTIFVLLLAGLGTLGFSFALILGWGLWKQLSQNVPLGAIWIALLVHAQFNNTLLEPFHMLYAGILTVALWRHSQH